MIKIFQTDEEATAWSIAWLTEQGHGISAPLKGCSWMSVASLRRRFFPDLSGPVVYQRLNHAKCPHFAAKRGERGRLVELWPNAELLAWVRAERRPGQRFTFSDHDATSPELLEVANA